MESLRERNRGHGKKQTIRRDGGGGNIGNGGRVFGRAKTMTDKGFQPKLGRDVLLLATICCQETVPAGTAVCSLAKRRRNLESQSRDKQV